VHAAVPDAPTKNTAKVQKRLSQLKVKVKIYLTYYLFVMLKQQI